MIGWCAALLLLAHPAAAQPAPDETRAFEVRYGDGRVVRNVIGPTGRVSWTPAFPRVTGAETARDGLPLFALQFEQGATGDAIMVTVAVLYGRPIQRRVQVATVALRDERPIRVEDLAAFGIQPVTLALVTLPAAQLHVPSISSPSSQLAIDVEIDAGATPAYYFLISNRSAQPIMSFAFTTFRGGTRSVTGRPRGNASRPLIDAGGTYVLRVGASTAPERGRVSGSWLPMDRLEITSVTWGDGLVEGDPRPAAMERLLGAGSALQLARALEVLRAAGRDALAHPVAAVREDIARLSVTASGEEIERARQALADPGLVPIAQAQSTVQSGMQNAKNAILNDIDEWTRSGAAGGGYAPWLARMIEKYAGWLGRLPGQ